MQHHIIKRQIIDLKIDGRLTANDIQDRVSQIYKDKLIPILNRYLDTLSETDSVERINNLEIDLGAIRNEDLEFVLEERLGEQLYLANPKIASQPKQIPVPVTDEPLSPTNQPEIDLIAYFLQTGTLPWWVKEDKQQAFKNAAYSLIEKGSAIVTPFFGRLLQDSIALKRLIFTADDDLLGLILTKIAPRYKAANPSLTHLYQYLEQAHNKTQFKELWWTVLLTNTLRLPVTIGKTTATLFALYFDKLKAQETALLKLTGTSYTTLATFYKQRADVLQAVINAADILPIKNLNQQKEYNKQITQLLEKEVVINSTAQIESLYNVQVIWNKIRGLYGLEQVGYEKFTRLDSDKENDIIPDKIKDSTSLIKPESGSVDSASSPKNDLASGASEETPNIIEQEIGKQISDEQHQNSPLVNKKTAGKSPLSDINPELQKSSIINDNKQADVGSNAVIDDTTKRPSSNDVPSSTDDSLTTNENIGKHPVGDAHNADLIKDSALSGTFSERELIQIPPSESSAIEISGLDLLKHLQPQFRATSGKLVSSFSDTDRLYIPYSGLVLLWPFLERFFSSTGLIDKTGFIDGTTATKACLLLQYISEGSQWQRFEPNLPLNKLLCGIDLFEPVDVNIEITEDELAAADHLLEAVIGNAPLWKSLTTDGLRSAYLQRDGILSSRDGNWLLQVQRQTYDILLDRLPWSVSVVKLPWMNNLIFVEWQQI